MASSWFERSKFIVPLIVAFGELEHDWSAGAVVGGDVSTSTLASMSEVPATVRTYVPWRSRAKSGSAAPLRQRISSFCPVQLGARRPRTGVPEPRRVEP